MLGNIRPIHFIAYVFYRGFHYWLGNFYLAQGNLNEARAAYIDGQTALVKKGEKISPDMATCLYKLGLVSLRQYYARKDESLLAEAR